QAFSQPLNSRARIMFTKEGPATEDDSYMGYSVTTGDFIGNGDSGTAVGVPRGSDLLGKVILFTSNMTNPRNITGEQMGAYFGYAVASGDIDGDGLDDLLVGAPMYTIPDNPEMTIETGRAYVIYQGVGPEKFRKVDSRDGESNRGRFGLSLASLGDIDRDGYGDFAVGAPYAGPRSHGAVYVYHGSPTGVLEKYSQVIYAENLDVPVDTFGFSVAGGLDLDGNLYPDLVVGAYESGTAIFYRSRPVIKMDSYVSFDLESKLISLDDRNCTLSDGNRVTCLPLRACFRYNGEGVFSRHNFNIQYVLDVKKTKSPRLFFLELEGKNTMNRTIMVDRDRQFCRTVQVYVTPNIRDKLTSLDAEMRMSLDEERYEDTRTRDPRIPLRPILGSTTSRKDSLSIRKNCGSDNVCIPDLQMNVTSNVQKYLLGSGKRLQLDVLVQNTGEDAFEATYNLKLPAGIDYIKVEKIETMGVPVQCSAPKQSNNNTLRCDIGNPLQKHGLVKFKVLLQPVTSHGMKPIYEFEMNANTTNPENPYTIEDNGYILRLPIWIETDLRIDGESKPKDLYYNPDNYTSEINVTAEAEFGPAMTHNYTIRNQGPSDVVEAEAFLIWPAQTLAGNELLYLLEQPETSGPIVCESANANYLSLKLDQRKRLYHSYHSDPSGVISNESQGRTINVQRGFDTGNQRPDVLITTHHARNDSETSSNAGDSTAIGGNRGVPFRTESGDYGETTTLDGSFGSSVGDALNTRVGVDSESRGNYGSQANRSATLNSWNDRDRTRLSEARSFSSERFGSDRFRSESDERYQEQQAQQRREEEEARERKKEQQMEAAQRQREEQERSHYQRRQEEERRRQQEEAIRRQQDEQRRRTDEEERYRLSLQEKHQRRVQGGLITGDREETVRAGEFGFQPRNVSSTQQLERLFGSLSKSATGYELHDRQGKHYVQFMGRFRNSADRREYIEFQDGSAFPLQDHYGGQSYASASAEPRDVRFSRMEGELAIDSTGKGFIVLKDGRRFPLQGSFAHTERESTYALDPHGSYQAHGEHETKVFGQSWNEEKATSSQATDAENNYESRYTSTHEVRRTEDRRVAGRTYGRENRERSLKEEGASSKPIRNPSEGSRFKRDSIDDTADVEDFKKFEKLGRIPRDLGNDDDDDDDDNDDDDAPTPQNEFDREDYENDPRMQGSIDPCNTAKCVMLKCILGPLKKDQEVWIGARYRVDARTLKKVALQEKVRVSTKLVARVTKQPFIGTPAEQVVKSHEIKTNVEPSITPSVPDVIPLWVVVLSACAGTIILLLLIFLLHK
ncbi:unnamed protein product, partial [Heterotrigona itama]